MSVFSRKFARPGSAPGLLAHPEGPAGESRIRVIHYSSESLEEKTVGSVEETFDYLDRPGVTWIDFVGLGDLKALERLGERLGIHSLALEDVVHTGQRPKVEESEGLAFVILKQLRVESEVLKMEQVSLFFGEGFVLTVQESAADDWEPVRERLRAGRVRIRGAGADYLTYALMDSVIDSSFPLLEHYGDRIEALQEELLEQPDRGSLQEIHQVNRELILVRRAAWPHREVVNTLERTESGLVRQGTRVFLRDCYDHTVQILDILESYRDLSRGLMDLYLSLVSNRMNEVMKVLTIMASIFIPLTFIAGIYGMNFDTEASPLNMPELGWYWGYPAFWGVMLVIGGSLVVLFKRKNWW